MKPIGIYLGDPANEITLPPPYEPHASCRSQSSVSQIRVTTAPQYPIEAQ